MLSWEPTRLFNYQLIIITTTVQTYKTGACMIQILQEHELEHAALKIKRTGGIAIITQSQPKGTGRSPTTSEFSDLQ